MTASGTAIVRDRLATFIRERAERRPGCPTPLTRDAQVEFGVAVVIGASAATAWDATPISHIRHAPLRRQYVRHNRSMRLKLRVIRISKRKPVVCPVPDRSDDIFLMFAR